MAGAHRGKESFHFGFDALVALAQEGPAKANVVLSPASLIEALGLVDLGASPELHTALIKLLRLDPNDKEATSGLRRSVAPLFQQGRVGYPLWVLRLFRLTRPRSCVHPLRLRSGRREPCWKAAAYQILQPCSALTVW